MKENEKAELKHKQIINNQTADTGWKSIYGIASAACLIVVLITLLDIIINFIPGQKAEISNLTVLDFFEIFQDNWFFGLRYLGFFNIIITALMVPIFIALYAAHSQENRVYAALAAIILFIGTAVYISNNNALSMLELSRQYGAATTEDQKVSLLAAGKTLLVLAEDFTPGSFAGFFLSEIAGIIMAFVILRGKVFSKLTAIANIVGHGFLTIFIFWATFIGVLFNIAMIIALIGGISMLLANILISLRLFKLRKLG